MGILIRCVVFVLVFVVQLGVNGLCVWPCNRQQRSYTFVGSLSLTQVYSTPCNPTLIETNFPNRTGLQCIERSGPFYSLRINNGTHDLYRCNKDTLFHPNSDVLVMHANPFKYFETPPTICEVCDGIDYNTVLTGKDDAVNCRIPSNDEIPELGCNIPAIYPVTMEGQIQCTKCEPSEGDDDGLCCKPKRLRNNYKSYNRRYRPSSYNRRNRPNRYERRNRPNRYNRRNRPNRYSRRNRPNRYNRRNRPNRYNRRNRPNRYNRRNRPNRYN